MCGIAGIIAAPPAARLAAATLSERLSHRGPDDCGFLSWDGGEPQFSRDPYALPPGRLALVHRRLSIVDLSDSGWQPMRDAEGRHAIVFNGEIYNHMELRAELEREGVRLHSQSDTEVLLQLLIRQGEAGLRRAVGMFAFAWLDGVRRRLMLGRDPFGIKPLFYARQDEAFAFASEIRPLLAIGMARPLPDPRALYAYLRHGVTDHGEDSFFADVRQVPPAHLLEIDLDRPATAPRSLRYWAPAEPGARLSPGDAVAGLRARLEKSVRLHMRADVPVAATLSGGIDSSGIVGLGHAIGQGFADVYSYVAQDPVLDEEHWIDMVAAQADARAHKVRLDPDAFAAEADTLIRSQEQPFTSTSIWAQAHVFRAVHEGGYKVVLDGQGADELFAGYGVFRAARLAALLRHGRMTEAVALIQAMPAPRRGVVLQALAEFLPPALKPLARRLVGRPEMPDWLGGAWFARHGVAGMAHLAAGGTAGDLRARLVEATTLTSLPMLLRYADRNAMAVSVENRVPYLTTELADFALALPDELLIAPDGTTKQALRLALAGRVPQPILDRRDKIGFATPEARWFTERAALQGLLRETAGDPLPPCLTPVAMAQLRAVADGRLPYDSGVWRCANLLRWGRLFGVDYPA